MQNRVDRQHLLEQVLNRGWRSAINAYMAAQSPMQAHNVLKQLRLRMASCLGLLDTKNIDVAITLVDDFGGFAISLSRRVKTVYAFYHDEIHRSIIKARCEYLNIQNIEHCLIHELKNIKINSNNAILVARLDDDEQRDILRRIKKIFLISNHFIVRSGPKFNFLGKMQSENIYFLTGHREEPFSFIGAKVKREQLGFFAFQAFLLRARWKKQNVISTNSAFDASLFGEILNDVTKISPEFSKSRVVRGFFVKPLGALLEIHCENTRYMMRIALSDLAKEKYQRSANILKSLSDISALIPGIELQGDYQGYYYQIETAFHGKNIVPSSTRDIDKRNLMCEQAFALLISLQQSHCQRLSIDSGYFKENIQTLVHDTSECFSEKYTPIFERISKFLEAQMIGFETVCVISHGDFSVDNFLFSNSEMVGLIDWEFANLNGHPIVDCLFFIVSLYKSANSTGISQAMEEILIHGRLSNKELQLLERYCEQLVIDKNLILSYRIITLLEFFRFRLDIPDELDKSLFYDRNYAKLLNQLDLILNKTE